ncbi:hypothetical protein RINTHH_8570 [Richelia intracellularis HH01]|uniref:Uncharacterized protein n=1 Tax=Richelia intracellularis HH01 TaxID=1165094 RepID=M1WYR3_9NOST|nr:hypothetical protein RINTHH_8570 [Richelia intracellularis HH01]
MKVLIMLIITNDIRHIRNMGAINQGICTVKRLMNKSFPIHEDK